MGKNCPALPLLGPQGYQHDAPMKLHGWLLITAKGRWGAYTMETIHNRTGQTSPECVTP